MAVQDGQIANAANFNARLLSRTVDTSAAGKIDLKNSGSAEIDDIQSHHNAHMSQDKMFLLMNAGAKLAWDGSALTFTDDIKIYSKDLNVVNTITSVNSPINLSDGQSAYVTVSRATTGDVVPSVGAAPIPATKDVIRLATRIGTRLVLWDNTVLNSGGSGGFGDPSFQPVQETPGGVVDGSNKTFTLSSAYKSAASVMLYIDGILMRQGTVGTPLDYYMSDATTLTLTAAPQIDPVTAEMWVTYFKE